MKLDETFIMELARFGIRCHGVTEEGNFLLIHVDETGQDKAASVIFRLGNFREIRVPSPGILMVVKDDLPGDRPLSMPGTYCAGCAFISTHESPCWFWSDYGLWLCFVCSIVFVPIAGWPNQSKEPTT